ncbi:competence/damage-inducible protein A [Nitratiruptor sp. SB155-2]|uniref:competence/damage-inducible protein A n=1 Tax=Nitratiruptor sp. (strain SB155-2) TaxID=387092 RepID=UPI0001587388|nr:competence/damage-inducible protein A [Nitratiruptor sp. SB155-2]BAF69880.1 molybdenum cofactor biosynthesis protein [Nitratiruptor sp. SB155-2]
MKTPNFYAIIIGTEILNGRRVDKHFPFLRDELLKRGFTLKASSIIEDDPALMESFYRLIKSDPNSVLFSFGGIGATPDDHTRMVAAKVFGDGKLYEHPEAKRRIIDQFKEAAYPYRINMAMLPKGAKLLDNPVNNVPGFYIENRFFFVPGFPEMAHPMVRQALDLFFPKNREKFRYSICIDASENDLLDIMQKIPKEIEFSSLPSMNNGQYMDVLSIASYDKKMAKEWFDYIIHEVEKRGFSYKVDNCR